MIGSVNQKDFRTVQTGFQRNPAVSNSQPIREKSFVPANKTPLMTTKAYLAGMPKIGFGNNKEKLSLEAEQAIKNGDIYNGALKKVEVAEIYKNIGNEKDAYMCEDHATNLAEELSSKQGKHQEAYDITMKRVEMHEKFGNKEAVTAISQTAEEYKSKIPPSAGKSKGTSAGEKDHPNSSPKKEGAPSSAGAGNPPGGETPKPTAPPKADAPPKPNTGKAKPVSKKGLSNKMIAGLVAGAAVVAGAGYYLYDKYYNNPEPKKV